MLGQAGARDSTPGPTGRSAMFGDRRDDVGRLPFVLRMPDLLAVPRARDRREVLVAIRQPLSPPSTT